MLLKLIDEHEGSQYEEKGLQQITYNILQMLGGPETEHYLEKNIVNPSLRNIVLEKVSEVSYSFQTLPLLKE